MFGRNEAEAPKGNGSTASGIVTALAATIHRRPLTHAELAARQEWLRGVVSAWTVGRSI